MTTAQPPDGILATSIPGGQRRAYVAIVLTWSLWTLSLVIALADAHGGLLPTGLLLAGAASTVSWWGKLGALRWPTTAGALATALLLFGALEHSDVLIEVNGRQLSVEVDGSRLSTTDPGPLTTVGLKLDAYETSRAAGRSEIFTGLPGIGPTLQQTLNGNLLAGLTALQARGAAATTLGPDSVLWQPYAVEPNSSARSRSTGADVLQDPDGPYQRVGAIRTNSFQLAFQLLRPSTPTRVLLAGTEQDVEIVVYPEQSAITIYSILNHRRIDRVAGGPLVARKSLLQSAQQLARQLGRALLTSMTLVAVVLLAGLALARAVPLRPVPASTWRDVAWVALALSVAALLVAAYVASSVLERMPHVQDSVAYLFQAKTFALGKLSVPLPPVPAAFEHEFVFMRDGLWYSKYPPGHAAVLALGVLVGAPWLVAPVAAGLTLLLTFLFGREVYGPAPALLAQALLVTSPFFLLMSGTMMSHPTGLLFAMLFLWQLVLAERRDSSWSALVAGFALGMLGASRALTAAAIGAPALIWVLARSAREGRIRLRHAALVAGLVPPLLAVLAYNQALTGDWLVNPFELWWSFDHIGFGPDIGMHGGHYFSWGLVNTWSNLAELGRFLSGWPVQLTLAFAFVPFLTGSRNAWDWMLGVTVLSVIGAYIFYWADGIMYGPRYYYETVAIFALLSARGVERLGELATRAFSGLDGAGQAAQALALTIVGTLTLVTVSWHTPLFLAQSHGYNGMDRTRADTVERAALHNALVLVVPPRHESWQIYGSVFWANDPLLDGDVVYARDLGDESDQELARAFPGRSVYRLDSLTLKPFQAQSAANP